MNTRGPSRIRRAPARFVSESTSESDEEINGSQKKGSAKVMNTRGPSRARRAPVRFISESSSESEEKINGSPKKGSAKVKTYKSSKDLSISEDEIKLEPTSEDEIDWFNYKDYESDEDETYTAPARAKKTATKTAKTKTEMERAKKKSAQSKMKVKMGSEKISTKAKKENGKIGKIEKYECSYCGKHFINATNLKCHERIHTGEKPYQCNQCGNRFTQLATLKYHERIHMEKMFECEICHKKLRRKYHLNLHMERRHKNGRSKSPSSRKYKLKTSLPSYPFKISKPHYHNPNIKYHTPPTVQKDKLPQPQNTPVSSAKENQIQNESAEKKYPGKILTQTYRNFPSTPKPQKEDKSASQNASPEKMYVFEKCKILTKPYRNFPSTPNPQIKEKPVNQVRHPESDAKTVKQTSRECSTPAANISKANHETQQLANQLLRLANQDTVDMDTETDANINDDDVSDTVPSTPASYTVQTSGILNQKPSSNPFQTPESNTLQTPTPKSSSHIRIDPDDKPFKCKYCTKRFKVLGEMRSHETISCTYNAFSKENGNQDEYEDNSDSDSDPPKRYLRHDKWVSKSKHRMPAWRVEKLLKKNPQFEKIFGRKPDEFPCKICDKIFFTRKSLQHHQLCHSGERSWCCSFCGKAFTEKANLKTHERIHTGEKPYECKHCKRRFTQQSTWKSHEATHSDERPFQCKICHKSFRRQYHLTLHDTRIHRNSRTHVVQPGEVVIIEKE